MIHKIHIFYNEKTSQQQKHDFRNLFFPIESVIGLNKGLIKTSE